MKLAIGIITLLFLNAVGGIVGKYIALSSGWLVLVLTIALFGSFGARAVAWIQMGKHYQLSYVYPFMSLNFVMATFLGQWLFNEPVTLGKVIGSALIMTGVLVLSTSKSMVTT